MNRGWLVLLAAVLLALLLAPILLLLAQSPAAAPGVSTSPSPSAVADQPPSAEPVGGGPDGLDPARMAWSIAMQAHDANGIPEPSYVLQAGTLAAEAPMIDVAVPYVTRGDLDLARHPAITAPTNGAVLYVTDDGEESELRRMTIAAEPADALVLELDEIVWNVTVDPAGTTAYLATVERDGADAGVVALALDGSEPPRRVMEPVAATDAPQGIRLVAVVPFLVELRVSLDGAHLLRYHCTDGRCGNDVLDLVTGEVTDLGDRQAVDVVGGHLLHYVCRGPRCGVGAFDLATGEEREIVPVERNWVLSLVQEEPVLLAESELALDGNAHAIQAISLDTGERTAVARAPAGGGVSVLPTGPFERLTLPDGVVLIDFWAGGANQRLAIDLASGDEVIVPHPPIRPVPGIPQG
jgi:hypothetical protein